MFTLKILSYLNGLENSEPVYSRGKMLLGEQVHSYSVTLKMHLDCHVSVLF